jgi:sigma-E factor negative regulatory protein RseC
MLEEHGIVVDADSYFAWVETVRKSSCGQCAESKGCGTAALAEVVGNKPTRIRVQNTLAAKTGDHVVIGLEESALLRSSLTLYMLPLVCLFIMALCYESVANYGILPKSETYSLFSGLLGMGIGFLIAKSLTTRMSNNAHYQPILLKIE